jgi:hypothetical protein
MSLGMTTKSHIVMQLITNCARVRAWCRFAYFLHDPLVEFDFSESYLLMIVLTWQNVSFHRRARSLFCDKGDPYRYRVDGHLALVRSMNNS